MVKEVFKDESFEDSMEDFDEEIFDGLTSTED